MNLSEGIRPVEAEQVPIDARLAMGAIDEIITDVYLPFRGAKGYETERAVLLGEPNAEHRENDAEHSWHLAFTVRILWDLRHELGIPFDREFDIDNAIQLAVDHDVLEIWSGDVNAMTRDTNLIELKAERERGAQAQIQRRPTFVGLAQRLEEYEKKNSPEAQYVSDLDKILATRIIYLDGGKKWHDWEGDITTRNQMCQIVRGKLRTELGHALFDVQESDIKRNPHVFPDVHEHDDVDIQLRIF